MGGEKRDGRGCHRGIGGGKGGGRREVKERRRGRGGKEVMFGKLLSGRRDSKGGVVEGEGW